MSDEELIPSGFAVDTHEEVAATERTPAPPSSVAPVRGAALSVLWWIEGDAALAQPS